MAVPEYHRYMRPILELLADGKICKMSEVMAAMVQHFDLSPEDAELLLPSGGETVVHNRVGWALTYLRKARLVESPQRGVNQITARGRDYLNSGPKEIRSADLEVFPEFADFHKGGASTKLNKPSENSVSPGLTAVTEQATPEEAMGAAYVALNDALAQEILDRVKAMPPTFFERLIVQLMLRLGYGGTADDAGQTLGKSGDGGVDGVINQDKLGLEKIYLQAKRWDEGTVGRPEIQRFIGALTGQHATKGVFITTSTFTQEARQFARFVPNFKISLVDGVELARLMIEHNLGVTLVERYEVKRVDSDFFSEA